MRSPQFTSGQWAAEIAGAAAFLAFAAAMIFLIGAADGFDAALIDFLRRPA